MQLDLWRLYRQMLFCRRYEEAVAEIWHEGLISGEMHLGTGEEAIIVGVVSQLTETDALALDHRGTAAMLTRGVDPISLLREFLGRPDGLCKGMGGHMHLFSPKHLAASSGIVGAAGPAAVGFALAGQYLRPGSVAVAFFGDGAVNQGMLMEAMNLAVVWKLPVLFVCKDDQWAITTSAETVIGNAVTERARGFGMPALEVDGNDIEDVFHSTQAAIMHARDGGGPTFIHARCSHVEGHFLGYQLLRIVRKPLQELGAISIPLVKSFLDGKGAPVGKRLESLGDILSLMKTNAEKEYTAQDDPLQRVEQMLSDPEQLQALKEEVNAQVEAIIKAALETQTSLEGAAT